MKKLTKTKNSLLEGDSNSKYTSPSPKAHHKLIVLCCTYSLMMISNQSWTQAAEIGRSLCKEYKSAKAASFYGLLANWDTWGGRWNITIAKLMQVPNVESSRKDGGRQKHGSAIFIRE